ncbi:GNAT family N-acetyltransferase [Desulfosporosinus lacus]|uniref:Ribosomal protein S18 acetylase RimI n=1 Tax=Desulfosporosinus lacus DSM 15449 TaxID=1121420 RepID=A0A1M5S9C4_9FIRM|nr:GNAT family N-acetyltransferase [Desulfosporosinus lacus]SHH35040.1 Ribosomal protein S18 acetylase RimI [Desulfosporosinus lacus DSM 15449]
MNMKTIMLNNKTIKYLPEKYIVSIYNELKGLNGIYPGFNNWYFNSVVNGLNLNSRSIVLKINGSNIMALAILKDTIEEKKICTLFVKNKFKGLGIGRDLMSQCLYTLDYPKPIITISANRMKEFKTLIKEFDFKLFEEYKSYYVNGLDEYSFNGLLTDSEIKQSFEAI